VVDSLERPDGYDYALNQPSHHGKGELMIIHFLTTGNIKDFKKSEFYFDMLDFGAFLSLFTEYVFANPSAIQEAREKAARCKD